MSQISELKEEKKDFFKEVIEQTSSISNEINRALKSTKEINGRTHMLSTTAKIEANRTGDVGRNFLIVSNSIDELSTKTDNALDKMKKETIQEIEKLSKVIENKSISIQGNRLADLALTNIRLIDRNLFERTADVRWWATENSISKALIEKTNEARHELIGRLRTILQYYTVYDDLLVCDMNGKVIANGQSANNKENADMKNAAWFQSALKTRNGESYGFNIMKENEGRKESTSLVFSCKVHRNGDVSRDTRNFRDCIQMGILY